VSGIGVILVAVLGFLASLVVVIVGDLVSEEVRARLDHLPHTVLRLAIRRLPANLRDDIGGEWQAELDHILHRAKLYPLTRLVVGVRYAAGLLRTVPQIALGLAFIRRRGYELARPAAKTAGMDAVLVDGEASLERLGARQDEAIALIRHAIGMLAAKPGALSPYLESTIAQLRQIVDFVDTGRRTEDQLVTSRRLRLAESILEEYLTSGDDW